MAKNKYKPGDRLELNDELTKHRNIRRNDNNFRGAQISLIALSNYLGEAEREFWQSIEDAFPGIEEFNVRVDRKNAQKIIVIMDKKNS